MASSGENAATALVLVDPSTSKKASKQDSELGYQHTLVRSRNFLIILLLFSIVYETRTRIEIVFL